MPLLFIKRLGGHRKTYVLCQNVACSELPANVIVEENLGGRPVGWLLRHLHANRDAFPTASPTYNLSSPSPNTHCS